MPFLWRYVHEQAHRQLDPFETALLAELRREVAEHPAPAPAPRRPPRRRLKVAAAGAVATAAATVVAVGLTGGGPTASPAFAVDANPDGSVNIVIHELDDADGLEAALADHGIDATVHFVPIADGEFVPEPEVDGTYVTYPSAAGKSCGIDNGPGPATLVPSGRALRRRRLRAADPGRLAAVRAAGHLRRG